MVSIMPPPIRYGQPVNLLDNSDFAIAQAGYGGMHGATRYVADRWANTYGFGTFTPANPGIKMTYATNHAYANQRISNSTRLVGKTLTFAVMTDEFGLLLCSGQYTASSAVDARYFNDRCEIVIVDGSARIVVVEGALTVRWATCYEGEYTLDTLPAYSPRPFVTELLQCQRYYCKINIDNATPWMYEGTSSRRYVIEWPVMRIAPTYILALTEKRVWADISATFSVYDVNTARMRITSTGAVSTADNCYLTGIIELSADP